MSTRPPHGGRPDGRENRRQERASKSSSGAGGWRPHRRGCHLRRLQRPDRPISLGRRPADSTKTVYALDLRGRGPSDGGTLICRGGQYADDIGSVVQLAKAREPLPIFLLGHSAGDVSSCIYELDRQSELAGLICQSCAFQIPAPEFAIAAL